MASARAADRARRPSLDGRSAAGHAHLLPPRVVPSDTPFSIHLSTLRRAFVYRPTCPFPPSQRVSTTGRLVQRVHVLGARRVCGTIEALRLAAQRERALQRRRAEHRNPLAEQHRGVCAYEAPPSSPRDPRPWIFTEGLLRSVHHIYEIFLGDRPADLGLNLPLKVWIGGAQV